MTHLPLLGSSRGGATAPGQLSWASLVLPSKNPRVHRKSEAWGACPPPPLALAVLRQVHFLSSSPVLFWTDSGRSPHLELGRQSGQQSVASRRAAVKCVWTPCGVRQAGTQACATLPNAGSGPDALCGGPGASLSPGEDCALPVPKPLALAVQRGTSSVLRGAFQKKLGESQALPLCKVLAQGRGATSKPQQPVLGQGHSTGPERQRPAPEGLGHGWRQHFPCTGIGSSSLQRGAGGLLGGGVHSCLRWAGIRTRQPAKSPAALTLGDARRGQEANEPSPPPAGPVSGSLSRPRGKARPGAPTAPPPGSLA